MRLDLPDHGGGGGAVPGGVSAPPLQGGAGPHKQEHNLHLTRPGGRSHRLPAEVRGGHTGKLLLDCNVTILLSLCPYVHLSLCPFIPLFVCPIVPVPGGSLPGLQSL